MRSIYLTVLCAFTSWSLFPGCGQRTIYPVSGKIVYENNEPAGKELAGYLVMFEAEEKPMSAVGEIREDGTFQIGSERLEDGALLGKHKVAVFPPMPKGGDDLRPRSILAPHFSEFNASGLSAVIEPKTNEITLVVHKRK